MFAGPCVGSGAFCIHRAAQTDVQCHDSRYQYRYEHRYGMVLPGASGRIGMNDVPSCVAMRMWRRLACAGNRGRYQAASTELPHVTAQLRLSQRLHPGVHCHSHATGFLDGVSSPKLASAPALLGRQRCGFQSFSSRLSRWLVVSILLGFSCLM